MSSLTPTEKRWHYRKASAKSSPEHEGRDGPLQPLREVTTSQSSWFTWHLPINQDRVFHKLGQSVGLEEQRDVKDHVAVACRNANTPPPPKEKRNRVTHIPKSLALHAHCGHGRSSKASGRALQLHVTAERRAEPACPPPSRREETVSFRVSRGKKTQQKSNEKPRNKP